ncbi:MAG: hypothetical protein LAT75_02030 [Candidatus Cyclonatronum sp.]|uniref:hypothetical protein n=1 Tax=Cyclonatronum sp. TaxID=3024185 RepID=UPI0025BD5F0C|nr:hypothetical protein [Cyclonatronum sp.]MCC5932822.1 hypothetical protein [Balneolales bacterium]MCH8485612.1 hypothetical protein [Cyclonatronum sp.]
MIGLVLIVFVVPFIFVAFLGVPFNPVESAYYRLVPPENLNRTINNGQARHYTTFLRKAHETEGDYTLPEITRVPDGSNGAHFQQSFPEKFTRVEGLTFVHVNGSGYRLGPGESIRAEPGDVHYFLTTDTKRLFFQVRIEPGSQGFEKALYVLYGLENDGLTV